MSKIVIREAILSDYRGIGKVHVDSWISTYTGIMPDVVLEKLSYERSSNKWKVNIGNSIENPIEVLLVAEVNDNIIGFCCGGLNRDSYYTEFQCELSAIYILDSFQEQGIGAK